MSSYYVPNTVLGSRNTLRICVVSGFSGGAMVKNPPANAGDPGSISGEGNGTLFQYSCLENSMDRGTWWATVHGVTKSLTFDHLLSVPPFLPVKAPWVSFSELLPSNLAQSQWFRVSTPRLESPPPPPPPHSPHFRDEACASRLTNSSTEFS